MTSLSWRQQQSPTSQPRTPPLNWQQQLLQQQHQQHQKPDLSATTCFYPAFGKQAQNGGKRSQQTQPRAPGSKPAFTESATNAKRPEEAAKFPQPPVLLQRQQEPNKKTQPPTPAPAQNSHQSGPQTQTPSEFQALWNELYNIQVNDLLWARPASVG